MAYQKITVTCNECGHKQAVERRIDLEVEPVFHIVCHDCEQPLQVAFHTEEKGASLQDLEDNWKIV